MLNQAIKRNTESFPDDFMFRLSDKEWSEILLAQEGLSKKSGKTNSSQSVMSLKKHRGAAYLPYAFTEHGVTMLASVLRSAKARKMNIAIVRVFVALKKRALVNDQVLNLLIELRDRIDEHDVQLGSIYDAIENLLDKKMIKKAGKKEKQMGLKNKLCRF